MKRVNIIIPVNGDRYDEVISYYRDVLLFGERDGLLHLPVEDFAVALLVMTPSSEQVPLVHEKKQLPFFSFALTKNFLSYCLNVHRKGALFDMACRHPGGYYARIFDPVGNQFEIWCESEDDEYEVDTRDLPFFYTC